MLENIRENMLQRATAAIAHQRTAPCAVGHRGGGGGHVVEVEAVARGGEKQFVVCDTAAALLGGAADDPGLAVVALTAGG